jgi:hypothetical protein
LIGFVVGALFAPEAYQFFPYFAIAYTSALVATVAERERLPDGAVERTRSLRKFGHIHNSDRRPAIVTVPNNTVNGY